MKSSDTLSIDSSLQSLVQAMATFASGNPAFDPTLTSHTSLSNSYFGSTLTTATANAWH